MKLVQSRRASGSPEYIFARSIQGTFAVEVSVVHILKLWSLVLVRRDHDEIIVFLLRALRVELLMDFLFFDRHLCLLLTSLIN
jgi:hypothetical protein